MNDVGTKLARWQPIVLSVLRIMTGLLFLEHGTGKLLTFPHNPAYDHFTLLSLEGASGVCELVFGFLVTIGLLTRIAAFFACGEMAIGYFLAHAPRGFFPLLNGGEGALLFCFVMLYLVFSGPGPWSVDAKLRANP